MSIRVVLEKALEQATQQSFCNLFQVYVADPGRALDRFSAGLSKLVDAYESAAGLVAAIDEDKS